MPITKYVKDWLTRAEEDIAVTELLLKGGGFPNQICFHSQQAAEKFLKGFLAFHEKHVRKVHDLHLLLTECQKIDSSVSEIQNDATFLTKFYVETRYPGDFPEFSLKDAKMAYEGTLHIKNFILTKIKV